MPRWQIFATIGILVLGLCPLAAASETRKVASTSVALARAEQHRPAQLPRELKRADLYSVKAPLHPKAVLVLCPGCNDNGKEMVEDATWQAFARKYELGLVGISYESDMEVLAEWRGYHIASQGSGQVLIDGVRKIYGSDLPLLMYGVSSGALFICQFVEWRPDRVLAWSAYAAGWGGEQRKQNTPPGLIACGEYDGSRYGAMLSYFKLGRAYGKPWLWLSLPKTDHEISPPVEQFTRDYFASFLGKTRNGCWVDVDRKLVIAPLDAERTPSITGWLPESRLLSNWQRIHEP